MADVNEFAAGESAAALPTACRDSAQGPAEHCEQRPGDAPANVALLETIDRLSACGEPQKEDNEMGKQAEVAVFPADGTYGCKSSVSI